MTSLIDTYTALALGNVAGLAVTEGMDDEEIEAALYDRVRQIVTTAINDPQKKFWRSIDRAREGLYFIGSNVYSGVAK